MTSDFREVNQMQVTGQQDGTFCMHCAVDLDPARAWWWTWHGPTCTQECAMKLVESHHAEGGHCSRLTCDPRTSS